MWWCHEIGKKKYDRENKHRFTTLLNLKNTVYTTLGGKCEGDGEYVISLVKCTPSAVHCSGKA